MLPFMSHHTFGHLLSHPQTTQISFPSSNSKGKMSSSELSQFTFEKWSFKGVFMTCRSPHCCSYCGTVSQNVPHVGSSLQNFCSTQRMLGKGLCNEGKLYNLLFRSIHIILMVLELMCHLPASGILGSEGKWDINGQPKSNRNAWKRTICERQRKWGGEISGVNLPELGNWSLPN